MNEIMLFLETNAIEVIALLVSIGVAIYTTRSTKGIEKQKAELQQQIDRANGLNDRLTHKSNAQFDHTFEILKSLSEASFLVCNGFSSYTFIALMSENMSEKKEVELYTDLCEKFYNYRDTLYKCAPFIPENIFESFDIMLKKSYAFFSEISEHRKMLNSKTAFDRYTEIQNCHSENMKLLRAYLSDQSV